MAANKFATMLHKNTHKLIVILVYAVLEWVLILFLLLNSLNSYLIRKYVNYFGLKPPCSWCSTINHNFSSKDLVCETHANEISRLWYCTSHRKLSESETLCGDCCPFQQLCHGRNSGVVSFYTWRSENAYGDERDYRCSCCGKDLSSENYKHYLEPLWGGFESTQKGNLTVEGGGEERSNSKSSNSAECGCDHVHGIKQSEEFSEKVLNFHCRADSVQENDRSFDNGLMILNIEWDHDFDRLIPVELTNSSTISRQSLHVIRGEEEAGEHEEQDGNSVSKKGIERKVDLSKENEHISTIVMDESEVQQTEHRVLVSEIENSSVQMDEPKIKKFTASAQKEIQDEGTSLVGESESESSDRIEILKAELEAERKVLSALYTELEEERNAAAIAANQTMAMITRLQEEKAAMQMEALQYQRMMDEQSDYDQEALRLLNELMMKREKEKQKLEKELELYRKEQQLKLTRRRSSSISCSNGEEENEEIFIEPYCEEREETDEAWIDCIKHLGSLEDSVKEFEEERISILDELKELEGKLFTLSEEVKSTEQSPNKGSNGNFEESNGNDYGDGKGPTFKSNILLSLFNAAATEEDELSTEKHEISESSDYEMGKRIAIEEDIDHVYERLQALEADREFVKNCVSSLKRGDKGMDFLQEILQHLRDLKAGESQVRNNGDTPLKGFSIWESDNGSISIESSVQLGVE